MLAAKLIRDRRGAVATIIALASPALLGAIGFGTDMGLIMVERAQLQAAADAAATATRKAMNNAAQIDLQPDALAELDHVVKTFNPGMDPVTYTYKWGWYHRGDVDADLNREFGDPWPSQKNQTQFANGMKVTLSANHKLVFGPFVGMNNITLSRSAIAYKCSNADYTNIRIPDDINPTPPKEPAIWFAFGSATDPTPRAWVYKDSGGHYHPVYKIWSPTDLQDVSFVAHADGWTTQDGWSDLQLDTYCRGTYLVISWIKVDGAIAHKDVISATILRGSTNNSFATFGDQSKYPLDTHDAKFSYANIGDAADLLKSYGLDASKLQADSYPCGDSSSCPQDWYDFLPQKPTDPIIRDGSPERRSTIISDRRDLGQPATPAPAPSPNH